MIRACAWAHPAQRILWWGLVACGLQWMQPTPLVICVAVTLLVAAWRDGRALQRALRRLLALLAALMFVYGWGVPGQYLWPGWALSPTQQGLSAGGLQAVRLLGVVAALQLLLGGMARERLFAGMHALATPLSWVGVDRRVAALRLALTLVYAQALLDRHSGWRVLWRELTAPAQDTPPALALEWPPAPLSPLQRCGLLLPLLALVCMLWVVMF
ncbi:hypothetical protein N8I74_10415 [Chitiniphilus purpureus]|uniref:Energy-coupling factor transporter transmembrane protein EcfT n=1 Tax=Chitiniphilus purpureus TaxID=2981137 RepID=A0ABY6DHB4_9NEIS|nr:CbiQ family ECF transporter T component [Chitiniphilus sp. CD1]UXY13734.1 hypothetical protein N8I74_10415 [Chitiniphilus sp. CD1]